MKLLLVPALLLFAGPASAQDLEAMAKWTSYTVVHYKVVGEFSGETVLLKGSGQRVPTMILAQVTDRIEIEFDWDQQEFNLVGKPVIRNFPTKVGSTIFPQLAPQLNSKTCPALKLNGPLEIMTGVALKADEAMRMSGVVTLEYRRDQPGGSYPAFGDTDTCGEIWESSQPVPETSPMSLMAIPGMYLVMPIPDGQGGMKISADKKSLIVPPGAKGSSTYGWTWTYTPTGVK